MGNGRVGGSLSVFGLENGKVVDDKFCRVKGRFCKRKVLVGFMLV